MKRLLVFFLVILLLFSSACQANLPISESDSEAEGVISKEENTNTDKETVLPEDKTEEPNKGKEGADKEPTTVSPIQRLNDMRKFSIYPNGDIFYFQPTLSPSNNRTVFGDTIDSFEGLEDYFDGSTLHISALEMDLSIPDGYYVYILPGEYVDMTTGKAVELEFVREYVFTMMNIEKEELLQDIRGYLETEHNWNDPEYRGPGYVVFSVRVFRKEYLPIENMFTSLLADTGEYFSNEEFYISMGRKTWGGDKENGYMNRYDPGAIDANFTEYTTIEELVAAGLILFDENWPVENWIQTIVERTEQRAFLSESVLKLVSGEDTPFLYNKRSPFQSGTASYYQEIQIRDGNDTRYTLQCANCEASVLSEEWYETYQWALKELSSNSEAYAYPEVKYDFSESREYLGPEEARRIDKELREGWYTDTDQDQNIRAFVYANVSLYHQIDIEDIMIILKDTDEGKLYGAFWVDSREPHYLTFLEWGWNPFDEIDLEFARKYAEEEM